MEKKHQENARNRKKIRKYVRKNKMKKEVMETKIKKKKRKVAHLSCSLEEDQERDGDLRWSTETHGNTPAREQRK